jgi:hypothetical protein
MGTLHVFKRGHKPMGSTSSRLFLAAAVLAASPFASSAVRAEGLMDTLAGILGFEEEKPDIIYRERAPLVVQDGAARPRGFARRREPGLAEGPRR